MAYSAVGDLLLDGVLLATGFNKQKFVDDAAEEMDSKLGWLYALPIHPEGMDPGEVGPTSWQDLPTHQVILLKQINNRLASGRLILAIATPGEQTTLHAYGYHLVQQALADLMFLANGDLDMDAEKATPSSAFESKAPAWQNPDSESLLLGFEESVMRGVPFYSRPGVVP